MVKYEVIIRSNHVIEHDKERLEEEKGENVIVQCQPPKIRATVRGRSVCISDQRIIVWGAQI